MTTLRVAFADYGDPSLMPNAIAVTDEWMEAEHNGVPPYFARAVAEEEQKHGATVRIALVEMPEDRILGLFAADAGTSAAGSKGAVMRLRVLFVAYADTATTMPNAMEVIDEYLEDDHGGIPDFWAEKSDALLAAAGAGARVAEAFLFVSEAAVRALFQPPVLKGLLAPVVVAAGED